MADRPTQIERMQGLQWGDAVRDSSLYFDGHSVVLDVIGRDVGARGFVIRALNGQNVPTELFRVNKDGTVSWTGSATVVNVKLFAATGDGTTDDRAAILAAEASLGAGGGTLFFPSGTYRTATSLTLLPTTNLMFPGGATLAPANGTVVTIGGAVLAGPYQIFQVGAGTVAFDLAQTVYPEWWGATTTVKTAATGGAITSGLAVLTTGGSPAFAAADVGKIAVVLGAGASGAPLVTTVLSFQSASQVTLAANAGTTVTQSRWAVGTDQTAAVNACLVASAAGAAVCPVALCRLYGVSGVKLRALQTMYGVGPVDYCGFVRLATSADPCVSLDAGVSGDSIRLENFGVNAMFFGALDGIEIGTASAPLALSNAVIRNVMVRNAGGWGFNLRSNGLVCEHLIAKHDQAPPAANTTAGGYKDIDTLVYANVIGCLGTFPAGAHNLGAGGGSVYRGIEAEVGGTFATTDVVTVNTSNTRILGLYVSGSSATYRDVVRIPTGFLNHCIEGIFVGSGWTMTNILNDVDRAYTMAGGAPLAGNTALALYRNRTTWAQADVATLETTTSTSYVNLTTTGPAVTLSPGSPQDHAVEVSADMANSTTGICLISPALSGGVASDANSSTVQGTNQATGSRRTGATNQANGATHTLKYRVTSGTGSFSNRRISAEVLQK